MLSRLEISQAAQKLCSPWGNEPKTGTLIEIFVVNGIRSPNLGSCGPQGFILFAQRHYHLAARSREEEAGAKRAPFSVGEVR